MKSIFQIIFLLTFFTCGLPAQPLVDALRLKAVYSSNLSPEVKQDSFYKILYKYAPPKYQQSPEQVLVYFGETNANPYLIDYVHESQSAGTLSKNFPAPEKALSALGDLDVTNFAFGMADFIVERTKTELNTAFFRRFQQELNKEKYTNLRILFPETVQLLDVIGIEIYQFDHYLNSLRNAFARDLHSFAEHLPAVLDNMEKDSVFRDIPELLPILRLGLEMRLWISSDFQPGELLRLTAESENLADLGKIDKVELKALVNAVRFNALLSESFRNSSDSLGYWVDWKKVEQLKDETTLRMYLGLLFEESKKPPYNEIILSRASNGSSLDTLKNVLFEIGSKWDTLKAKAEEYRTYIIALSKQVKPVMQSVEAFRATQRDLQADKTLTQGEKRRRLFDNASDVYASFISLLDFVLDERRMPPGIRIRVPEEAKIVFNYAKTGSDICLHLAHKEYAGAVAKVTGLLGELSTLPESRTIAGKKKQLEPAAGAAKKNLEKEIADLEDKIKEKKREFAPLLKYGTFMANVVEAEDEEQVKKAIEAVALPPGSYTIKRESRSSVSLNAYLGGLVGNEYIEGEVDNKGFNNWAITAPVGVTLSLGNICSRSKRPASLSAFFPIIDVGAIASFRFKDRGEENAKLDQVSEIKLKNILAPGIFFELGIWGTPLTLGAGVQVGPRLRQVTGTAAETIGNYYVRTGLTLKVDIPIMHFAASPAK